MSGFFSHSSSRRRYPDPNMGGAHYRRKGLFGMLSGLGSGFSSRSSRGHYGQGYPNQGYPNQGYPDLGQGGFQPTARQRAARQCARCAALLSRQVPGSVSPAGRRWRPMHHSARTAGDRSRQELSSVQSAARRYRDDMSEAARGPKQ